MTSIVESDENAILRCFQSKREDKKKQLDNQPTNVASLLANQMQQATNESDKENSLKTQRNSQNSAKTKSDQVTIDVV